MTDETAGRHRPTVAGVGGFDPWDEPEPVPAVAQVQLDLIGDPDARLAAELGVARALVEAEYHGLRNAPAVSSPAMEGEVLLSPRLVCRFSVPGTPKGQPRARAVPLMRGGKPVIGKNGRPVVVVHRSGPGATIEATIRLFAAEAMLDAEPMQLPVAVMIESYRAPAPSWPKRVQQAVQAGFVAPTGKPDPDNIAKAVLDACNGVVWADDSLIVDLRVRKGWSDKPGVDVTVTTTGQRCP